MGTRYRGAPEEVRALDTFIKLLRAANTVSARAHAHLGGEQLTVSQFGVLEALYHLGPLCQKDLSAKLLRSGGNMTLVVDNLEKRGLVRRQRGLEDRRFVTVHLTDAGADLIRRIFPVHVAGLVERLAHLSPSEQDELARLCRKLGLGQGEPPPCAEGLLQYPRSRGTAAAFQKEGDPP